MSRILNFLCRRALALLAACSVVACATSSAGHTTRSALHTNEAHEQSVLVAELGPRSIVRREMLTSSARGREQTRNKNADLQYVGDLSHTAERNSSATVGHDPIAEAQQHAMEEKAKRLMSCPGDFIKNEDFSKPHMCASASKKAKCVWHDIDPRIGEACGEDCFCDKADADYMNMTACKTMCKHKSPCFFTFTSSYGCRIYSACDAPKADESTEDTTLLHVDDWVTCQRFFENYSDVTVALHNKRYNRYLMIGADGNLTSADEVLTNGISSAMRFVVTNTSNIQYLNQQGDPSPFSAVNAEASLKWVAPAGGDGSLEQAVEGNQGTVPGETAANKSQDEERQNALGERVMPGENDEEDDLHDSEDQDNAMELPGEPLEVFGGPDEIALYSSAAGEGKNWMAVNHQTGKLHGVSKIDENALFTVCHQGPNVIALHNRFSNRYVMVAEDGVGTTPIHNCCKIPKTWHHARFQVVVPPPLTGHERTLQPP